MGFAFSVSVADYWIFEGNRIISAEGCLLFGFFSVFFYIVKEYDVDYSEIVYDFLDLLMDKVGSDHSEKRFHFIERIINLRNGFFELSDGVLFLNIVKRVFSA